MRRGPLRAAFTFTRHMSRSRQNGTHSHTGGPGLATRGAWVGLPSCATAWMRAAGLDPVASRKVSTYTVARQRRLPWGQRRESGGQTSTGGTASRCFPTCVHFFSGF